LERPDVDAVVDELVDVLELENSVFYSSARNKYILDKVRRVAAASCHAICRQIKTGKYRPKMIEHEISHNIALDGRELVLSGRVDRVDISANQIRIVDYKSGSAKFSAADALNGVQLQLVLYMNALLNRHENTTTPGGIFYFPVGNPIIDTNEILSDVDREDALFKAFKMSGMDVDDPAEFTQFAQEVENKVKELGTRMTGGDISARPARFMSNKKNPCEYCNFSGVCGNAKA
ncbi:MAG: PD-(D/E)XK nuclease family protein, partial [Defluviitaleaceae bacterium]|nr:PD-(D/E)XK nuclease family protein [Defluviitaleaceae bacterium]